MPRCSQSPTPKPCHRATTRSPRGRLDALGRICSLALAWAAAAPPAQAQPPIVATRSGEVSGLDVDGVATFKGIPFAAPPVGPLRWRPPQPAARWKGVRKAEAFGSPCMQGPGPGPPIDLTHVSEDCLTLNVWSPPHKPGERLPVMVIIPGGGFVLGASSYPGWDAAAISRRGIVVASFDYRLGVFGFLAHPALSKEDPSGTSGAYGLLDQIAALKWVKANIAAFGGDPAKVTIMGSSAGGSSVLYLMASPLAKGLFRAGISESAANIWNPPLQHLREPAFGKISAEAEGLAVGADISALRALPATALLARAPAGFPIMADDRHIDFWPIVDGHVLPDDPARLFAAGKIARVPLLIGSNADEGTVFTLDYPIRTAAAWRDYVTRSYPVGADTILAQYPAATDDQVHGAATRWITDWTFAGNARAVARAMSARKQSAYLYEFTRVNPKIMPLPGAGSFHSMETAYVFGNLRGLRGRPNPYDATDRALSEAMTAAWVRFVQTGDPNGAGLPAWPPYEPAGSLRMDFGDRPVVRGERNAAALDAFDKALARMNAAAPGH